MSSHSPATPTAVRRLGRSRRGGAPGWFWAAGIALALAFHLALIWMTRVDVLPAPRRDRIATHVTWLGDRVLLEGESTLSGQQLIYFNDDPLFLVTDQNYAAHRRTDDDSRPPGQIFTSFDPVLIMPVEGSPPGLIAAPSDQVNPVIAVQSFRWPYLERYRRGDPVERTFEDRRARIEVRSSDSGALVFSETLPAENNPEAPDAWPDWRPFEVFVSVSETGRLSEPLLIGGGSGSDNVDRFMRDYLRRVLRLDLRLGAGNYRILIGP